MYTALYDLGSGYWTEETGGTEAEALDKLLAHVRRSAELFKTLPNGRKVRVDDLKRLPREGIPETHGLLLLEEVCHSSGEACGLRIFAVRKGPIRIERGEWDGTIGDEPEVRSFLNSNSEYEFALPEGTLEFVRPRRRQAWEREEPEDGAAPTAEAGGKWIPCTVAKYTY